jgi:hypothetical protein
MGKYVVSVSSVAYNLAGDIKKRPDILKTTVLEAMYSSSSTKSLGNNISGSYLNGSGIKLKNYAKWVESSGYNNVIGKATGEFRVTNPVSTDVLNTYLEPIEHYVHNVLNVEITSTTVFPVAYKYIKDHYPSLLLTDWESDYISGNVVITFEDLTTVSFSHTLNSNSKSLIGAYDLVGTNFILEDSIVETTSEVLEFEPTDGLTTVSSNTVTSLLTLNDKVEVTHLYSDGTEVTDITYENPVESSVDTVSTVYHSSTINENTSIRKTHNKLDRVDTTFVVLRYSDTPFYENTTVDNGITTITKKYHSNPVSLRTTYIKEYLYIELDIKQNNAFAYTYGDGSIELDSIINSGTSYVLGDFYPVIPLRIDNVSIASPTYSSVASLVKRALYVQTGKDTYTKLLETLEDNPDLGDLDYVYNVIGVSLNTEEPVGKKYLYKFFDALYLASLNQGTNTNKVIHISTNNSNINYNIKITWDSLVKTTGVGMYKPTYKVGMVYVEDVSYSVIDGQSTSVWLSSILAKKNSKFKLVCQKSSTEWECIEVNNLMYTNRVYEGKEVKISAYDALMDDEESGFIIPISYTLFNSLSLVDSTQLSTSCSYLLINVYDKRKKKWYETNAFKVLLVIVAVAITIYTGGLGASSVGVLGTNISVGAALGFQGLAAVLIGAAVNSIAGMLILQIISDVSVSLFGKEVGLIVSAVLSLGFTTAISGKSIHELFNANTLLSLTKAAGDSYQAHLQKKYKDLNNELINLDKQSDALNKLISSKGSELFGSTGIDLDTVRNQILRDKHPYVAEGYEDFITRTMLSGSDIVNIVMSYVDTTLKLNEVR